MKGIPDESNCQTQWQGEDMAIQPIWINHLAANVITQSDQFDLLKTYSVE